MPLRFLLVLLSLAPACTPVDPVGGDDQPLAATIEPSEAVGTVATVRFSTASAATAVVEVTEPGASPRAFLAETTDGTDHVAVLVGLAAGVDYSWRAVATLDTGEVRASEPAVFATEFQPLWMPTLILTIPDEASTERFVLTTMVGDDPGVAILDERGRIVWWWHGEEGVFACQARLAADGRSVLLMVVDSLMQSDVGVIRRVSLSGEPLGEARATLAHHDFVELPDGRVGFLSYDAREWEGMDVVGDALVVLDLVTGAEETVWSSWDDLTPGNVLEYPSHPLGAEWTHANGLDFDEVSGDWLVSMHNISTIARVTGGGELRWQLGGVGSDFTSLADASEGPFAEQHGPTFTDEGILLFDNREPQTGNLYSRTIELRLDETAGTFETAWAYDGDRRLFTAFMGSAERLDDGSTLVGWGSGGRLERVDADGFVPWRVDVQIGFPLGFSHHLATLGERVP
ncbi:MAG: aryl-sulfate sulfotransferase [Pseudomonadota bacterium]|nr:aryl-sulfate sulfotransferase [Pseudomonadota bacterium]